MAWHDAQSWAEGLMHRAYEMEQCLSMYRAELHGLSLAARSTPAEVVADIRDLEDLLHIMDELRESVSQRAAHLAEAIERLGADAPTDEPRTAMPLQRLQRYLNFAGAAGIPVPVRVG